MYDRSSTLFINHWKTLFKIGITTALLTFVVSIFLPFEYSARVQVLIIPGARLGIDPYTEIKSAERIGENFSQIIYTSTFFEKVMNSGYAIDTKLFAVPERKKRKKWAHTISTQVIRGTGMLSITAFHTNKAQAAEIAKAVGTVLTTQGKEYAGSYLDLKVVDTVIISEYPVRPNFLMNALLGFVLGVLVGAGYLVLRPQKKKGGFLV